MLIRVPETVAEDRFIVTDRIGAGGMAIVHLAWDRAEESWCAVKFLAPEFLKKPTIRDRFEREGAAMGQIDHPHVLRLRDSGTEAGSPWHALDLARGGSIEEWLGRNGPMPPRMAAEVGRQAALGLGAAHAHGIVHRDVKPENLLIGHDGTIRVMDFGIARDLTQDSFTRTGSVMGTYAYMSPEQKNGAKTDSRTDVYGLAATIIAMCAGYAIHEVFALVHDPEQRAWIPDPLWQVLERALKLRAADRYADGLELAGALEAIVGELPAVPGDAKPLNDRMMELGEAPELPEPRRGAEPEYIVGESTYESSERVPQAPEYIPPPPKPKPKRKSRLPFVLVTLCAGALLLAVFFGGVTLWIGVNTVASAAGRHAEAQGALVRTVHQQSAVVSDLEVLELEWKPVMQSLDAMAMAGEGPEQADAAMAFVRACERALGDTDDPRAAQAQRRVVLMKAAVEPVERAHQDWLEAANSPLGGAAIAIGLAPAPPGA